ncbi:MAG: hypothetical protein ACRCYU_11445 [Nocardioides sp.]
MIGFGALLLIFACLAIAAAVFVSDGTAEILGVQFNALTIFLLGLAAGAAVLFGWGMIQAGAKRALRERKERKRIGELSIKLEQAQADRNREASEG